MSQGLAPFIALLLLAVGAAGGLVAVPRADDDHPWADINHAVHVKMDIECSECHVGVEVDARAGVPSVTICVDCHEEDSADDLGGTMNAQLIHDHVSRGEELTWPRNYVLPQDVVFSHRRHVSLGGIACETCHGSIASTTRLPSEPVWETLTMEACVDCHARSGADTDCLVCHR